MFIVTPFSFSAIPCSALTDRQQFIHIFSRRLNVKRNSEKRESEWKEKWYAPNPSQIVRNMALDGNVSLNVKCVFEYDGMMGRIFYRVSNVDFASSNTVHTTPHIRSNFIAIIRWTIHTHIDTSFTINLDRNKIQYATKSLIASNGLHRSHTLQLIAIALRSEFTRR